MLRSRLPLLALCAAVAAPLVIGAVVAPAAPAAPLERAGSATDRAPVVATAGIGSAERLAGFAAARATTTTTTTTTTVPPTTTTTTTTAPTVEAAPATTAPPPSTTTTTAPPSTGTRDVDCETSMLGWMNEERSRVGAAALTEDEAIQHVSLDWSETLVERGELSHNPDYGDQIFAVRPGARTAGENVGRSGDSARAVFDEFLRSDGHRAAIHNTRFTHTTVGCVFDDTGQLWVTVNFWG